MSLLAVKRVAVSNSLKTTEFLQLFTQDERKLYRYIFTLVPDSDQAQDVFQDTAMALWEKFDEYQSDKPFLPWACRFAYFKVLSHRKRTGKQPALLADDVIHLLAEEQIEENDWLEEQLRALRRCLGDLTDAERELIQDRYAGKASVVHIAETTGRPADSLYKILYRARKRLMECIARTLAKGNNP